MNNSISFPTDLFDLTQEYKVGAEVFYDVSSRLLTTKMTDRLLPTMRVVSSPSVGWPYLLVEALLMSGHMRYFLRALRNETDRKCQFTEGEISELLELKDGEFLETCIEPSRRRFECDGLKSVLVGSGRPSAWIKMVVENGKQNIYKKCAPDQNWMLAKSHQTIDGKHVPSILHLKAGDENWEPTTEEMNQLVELVMAAVDDPAGAVLVTRQGVELDYIAL